MYKFVAGASLLMSSPTFAHSEQTNNERIDLVCLGEGTANRRTSSSVYATNNSGESGWANIVGNQTEPFEDQVNLWVTSEGGEIRMPRTMLPAFRGGENGWFKIKNLEISATEMNGSVAVNLINNTKLRIDRITGLISISGKSGRYVGQCARYDPETTERAF